MDPVPCSSTSGGDSIRLSVIGTGYVGLVTALAFARHGNKVTCVDVITERVEAIRRGEAPFYEPGVPEDLRAHVDSGLVEATTDTAAAVERTEATFLCVGTPSAPDGSYDLTHVETASRDVGAAMRDLERYHLVVTKSTLTPTANRTVVLPALEGASRKVAPNDFSLASNPEFLREGSALEDALRPDRIVVGVMEGDERAARMLEGLFEPFDRPVLLTSLEGAELIKLSSNALLATKVAFANEVANLAASVGADGYEVLQGVGMDHRLGPHFLRAGAGFGGSCFPKDLRALLAFSEASGAPMLLPRAALEQNDIQPLQVVDLLRRALDDQMADRRVALLGLSFKADTDDVRETRALPIYRELAGAGARVVCHDPVAGGAFRDLARRSGLPDPELAATLTDALDGAEAAVIQTEWDEYRQLGHELLNALMREPRVVVDGRRVLDPRVMREGGIRYYGIGWPWRD